MRRLPLAMATGAVAVLALVSAGCSSGTSSGAYGAASTTTVAAGGAYGPQGTGDTSGAVATVTVYQDPTLGPILIGPNGHTLYLFTRDDGTKTACTGGCTEVWPALVATSPTAGPAVNQSMLSTATGTEPDQVVYGGHLLYYYAGDGAKGDTNGTKIPSWYAVGPDGNPAKGG